ncbi:MAG: Fe-S cluster assembly protein SufD [Gemmatimonadota bacterium]|nr:Fe-S cluster assembly protein SufD [Gemmatimonadota bacterium]
MTAPYLVDFGTISNNGARAEPAWLRETRRDGIDRFAALGFPTPRNEDWHFTSVAAIAEGKFTPLRGATGQIAKSELVPFTFAQSAWPVMVFVNGKYDASLSTPGALAKGIRAIDLSTAIREEPTLIEPWLGKVSPVGDRSFSALNAAFMSDGAVIHISPFIEEETPLHVIFVSDSNAAKGVAHLRNLIVAGHNSKATVIESYVSLGDSGYFTNAVTEVIVEPGATLTHYKIQRESQRAFHVHTIDTQQARDSHYVSFSFATGAKLSRTNIYTNLDGEGCGATLNGLYMADDEQHVDHQTNIIHSQPNCFSREIYKGILSGAAHGVFNGKVYVYPIAQKTDGKQTNNNLLLSERARIDTKPQLEIYADDVRCTHGATVGRLDEMALFYMKSRGVSTDAATRLLTYAFAADVLETIEVQAVRSELERATLERFTGAVSAL